jgi:YegS/Rv2252/BmrU family lipid kinase
MKNKKIFFVFNPISGKAAITARIGEIVDIFTKQGYILTTYPTQACLDCKKRVHEACKHDYAMILCSGGDGTLNEAIHGVMDSEHKIPIGYIPTGTTNDFARSLGIPRRILNAAKWLAHGKPHKFDIGTFNDRYFTYVAAFGAFTDVPYETSQAVKSIFGHAAYVFEGMGRLNKIKTYRVIVEHDDGIIEDDFVYGMVTNSSSVGGLLSQKNVVLDDGLFEVTLVKMPSNAGEVHNIFSSLFNFASEKSNDNVVSFTTSKIIVTSSTNEKISWTIDGEFGGEENRAVIWNNKQALEFIAHLA